VFRSIQARLFASYVLLVVLLVVVVGGAAGYMVTRAYVATVQREMVRHVTELARLANELGSTYVVSPATLRLADLLTGADVLLVGRDGLVQAESSQPARFAGTAFAQDLLSDVLRDGKAAARTIREAGHQPLLVAAAPLRAGGALGAAAILVYRSLDELAAARWMAIEPLLRLGGFGLVAAVLLALWLSRGIARPLERITLAARSFAAGDRGARSGLRGPDELGQLGRAFDDMAGRIEALFADITSDRDRQRAILAGVASGLFVVRQDGELLLLNEPARAALAPARCGAPVPGTGAATLALTDLPEALLSATELALRKGAAGLAEPVVREVPLGGGQRTAVVRLAPQPASGSVVGIIEDITELRALESMRRELVSNVSHELRTPVTSILGFLEALQDGMAASEAERQHYLGIIEEEARRLSRLIEDLFELSKLESGQMAFEFNVFDLPGLVRSVAGKLAIAAARGKQELEVTAPPEPMPWRGDADRLAEVMLNLLENALRFTPAGGKVSLGVTLDDDTGARIVVADSGPGIHADDLPRVFERFYTADKSRARQPGQWRHRGTGLGLAIAKHIVDAHSGTIAARNGPAGGAVFEVLLPRL
jgi:signal transduction histidine kinase